LELGYFLGKLPRERVCCLHKGKIDLPSDMAGILFVPFTSSGNECFRYIQNELRNANLIN
jgi:predicted nucleotide-binding protein